VIEKEKKRREKENRSGKKDMRGINQVREKDKGQGRMSRC
jgi:hypothetical protein